ncbi:MAG: hybrid sensor histidine kinase/response regulator, partial [Thermoanaerobaculia bacterium]
LERLMEVASHIAGIAIELHRADDAIRRQADELREADRQKDVFLAMLAHELRNPLATIRASLDLTARRGDDPETRKRAHGIMERQSRQLARLVDDLLDLSRFTRGHIPLKTERIAVEVLLKSAVETVQSQLDAGGHGLVLSLPAQDLAVNADPCRMIQVISNILSNAARYTAPGGTITLSASRVGANVEIAVTDTGIGMKPEFVGEVFDLFVQADCSLDRSQGGLGIGLTLVKKIVSQHGGKVTASSPGLGKGSTFVVTLPEVVASSVVPETSNFDRAAQSKPSEKCPPSRVLIVDDNTDIAEMLEAALAGSGRQIRIAHDGPAALEIVAEWDPDVVLLDIGLPIMDGYAVAERIRAGASGSRQPKLVAMTGYGGVSDRARSRESGFDLHLVKPVELETIEAAIAPGH